MGSQVPIGDTKAAATSALLAVAILAVGIFTAFLNGRNPFNDLEIIRHGKSTTANFVELYEKDYDEGGTHEGGVYTFRVPGHNQDFYALQSTSPTYVPLRTVRVEYSSRNPEINRAKGEGSQTLARWLGNFFGRLIFIGFFLPVVWHLIKQARHELAGTKPPIRYQDI